MELSTADKYMCTQTKKRLLEKRIFEQREGIKHKGTSLLLTQHMLDNNHRTDIKNIRQQTFQGL